MVDSTRDYKREYELQKQAGHSGSGSDSGSAQRHRLRRKALKMGMVKAGQDLDHKKPLSKGGSNTLANARATTPSKNRSFPRNSDGSMKRNTSK